MDLKLMSYWVQLVVLTLKTLPGKFPGKFLPGKPISGSFFPDFAKFSEIKNCDFEIVKVAIEKNGRKVKHSTRGPLLAGKGIRGLSQKGRFLGASEGLRRFGPELFSALRYPADFRIM